LKNYNYTLIIHINNDAEFKVFSYILYLLLVFYPDDIEGREPENLIAYLSRRMKGKHQGFDSNLGEGITQPKYAVMI